MEDVLFICDKIYLDASLSEGGVRMCTLDFIDILSGNYKVHLLEVRKTGSLSYRLKAKLGINNYKDYYRPEDYSNIIREYILQKGVRKVFLNLSNTIAFAKFVKTAFSNVDVKVILCSHGNESGDFLHESVRFKNKLSGIKRFSSSYRLGTLVKQESEYRLNYLDCVLTVSDVEAAIENWLGVKSVYMVPRTFKPDFLDWKPDYNRIGFVGDISHAPNFYGVEKVCEAIENIDCSDIEFRIVGKYDDNTEKLKRFRFVKIVGYLDNEAFKKEAATWSYFLNPVFYYSRGVSTKLEKGINWGLPVVTTVAGNRGYVFKNESVITVNTPLEMATELKNRLGRPDQIQKDRDEVVKIATKSVTHADIIKDLKNLFQKL
jgi:hypothetical protein